MKEKGFGYVCTVKDFYEYMKKQGKEDYQIKIQYRDDGGEYWGEDDEVRCFFDDENKVVIV